VSFSLILYLFDKSAYKIENDKGRINIYFSADKIVCGVAVMGQRRKKLGSFDCSMATNLLSIR